MWGVGIGKGSREVFQCCYYAREGCTNIALQKREKVDDNERIPE
jgi:hypothetical protein